MKTIKITSILLKRESTRIQKLYRFGVPVMHKVEECAMDDQYDVDNDEKVVRVPERIETSESIKRFG